MAESSTDHHSSTVNLSSNIEFSHLSQSDLFTLSVSPPSHRSREQPIAPVINRSAFNESAGSRRQTYSRLRLLPRDKQPVSRPATIVRAPRPISEAVEQENSQIISLLQDLFGVEPLPKSNVEEPNGGDNSLVPVQVEFQHSLPESAALPLLNIPIGVGESSQGKRKRGRPRKDENLAIVIAEVDEPKPKRKRGPKPKPDPKKVVEGVAVTDVVPMIVKENGLPVDAVALGEVGDPFGEELKRRTQGMENEEQLLAFLEGLNGEWGSDRKKRRIVLAKELVDLLPREWKIILILQKRAGRVSVICRRYVSPDGLQFDSYKEVSTYLLSLFGVQDINHLKSSYADGSQHFSSNINMALESKGVDCVPKGDMKADPNAIQLLNVKQATSSSIEKNSSDGNSNNGLTLGYKLGDTVGSTFRYHGNNTEDKHLISSVEDMEISDGKPAKDDSQQIISTRDQSEMLKDSAEGKCFDKVPGGYIGNFSVSTCLQDASKSGGVFVAPSKAAEDVSTDQRSKMDSLLMSNEYLSAFDDYVNNISAGTLDALDGNKSCLSEPSQSEVKMFQTDPVDMPKFQ
ncbi:hypothetical protein Lal_00002050 [Lupinus albus]|uniref:Putative DNA-binding domain-containing protein n=1 Tax=Lupinus albus TaxID=3870 RepID=A0A6A5PA55_LUPAL|nr:putative DNA-binding domain-containing protein [Lupinus albus]KAF1893559.1 hypothetical protein Lal_00002050 [Lupinus albus]